MRQLQNILLVDDDEVVREMLGEVLRLRGYRVECRADGAEGLHHYREQRSGLLITDIDMPVMNGLELIRAIRAEDLSTPIIAISGNPEQLAAAEILGANDTFIKPFDLTRFASVVEHLARG